jgi:Protein of unknown function (DUF1592)/Protein of unknown function (DUF1588)/Protein of unknown function (DUF1585)/Protein of unknown function (DUF1587)/Protein of unknown function (DUF1595)
MNKRSMGLGLVITAVLSLAFVMQGQAPQRAASTAKAAPSPQAVTTQQAMLNEYCMECHSRTARSGNLSIEDLNLARVAENRKEWEKIVRKLRAGMMPPVGQDRPDDATYKGFITWLENELDRNAVAYVPPPGLHRLNRTEYANAINDLLDLEIDPAQYLPSDDSTRGFDNIASALTVSSTLVEAYVSAAGKISRLAIGEPTTSSLKIYRVPEDTSQDYHVEGMPLGTRGGLLVTHIFPSDGEYTIKINTVIGDNMSQNAFGTVPCEKLEVLLDGERLSLLNWASGGRGGAVGGNTNCGGAQGGGQRGQADQAAAQDGAGQQQGGGQQQSGGQNRGGGAGMVVRFKTTAGPHKIGATFLATNFAPLLDMNIHPARTTVQTGPTPGYTFFPHVGSIHIDGPFGATAATDSASRRKIFICRPATAADEAACARRILTRLAEQGFRRQVRNDDLTVLMNHFTKGRDGSDFDHGIANALAHILSDINFLARVELEPPNLKPGEVYSINDTELASRLSYFLWSTGPDTELRTLAAQNRLHEPAVLEAQVRRMLKDPRAEALAVNFAGQWLNLRGMGAVGPLPMLYPDFDDPLRQAMRREVELLFDSIVREDRSLVDLLNADYTFVNQRLARHYGIPGIYGSQFRRVVLGPDMDVRRGLLGKGAFLTTTAKPERNSPVTRGKIVMEKLLGMPPPDPPPNVPPLMPKASDSRGNTKTPSMRQMMLEHRINEACVRCHSLMDPIGFTLENFDAIGLWRTEDSGEPIAASEILYDGTKVQGPAGLRNWLMGYSDQFVEVGAEKLLTYALGRGAEAEDMPLVRRIAREAARNDNKFSALVLGVVRSDAFRKNMKPQETGLPGTTIKKDGN